MIFYLILFIQGFIHRSRPIFERYMIKTVAKLENLGIHQVFNPSFYRSLSLKQLGGLLSIVSWRAITYPLGVLVASYSMQISYAASLAIGNLFELFFIPLNLFVINKGLNEFVFNQKTIIGLAVVLSGVTISMLGWYLIHTGLNG